VYAFHNNGGMFLRGPAIKTAGEFPPGDVAVYDYLGKNNEKIVPGYRYLIGWKDLYSTYGDFADFCDNLVGTYSFVGELFQVETESFDGTFFKQAEGGDMFGSSNEQDRMRLKYSDHVTQGELYKEWTPYKHPLYGDIEIGGWVKMSSRLPHPFMLQDLVHRNASAVIFSARQTPEVKLEVFQKEKIGKELYRIRVRLVNDKAMPSVLYHTIQHNLYPKDIITVKGNSAKVVSGGRILDIYRDQVEYKEYKPEVQFCQVPDSVRLNTSSWSPAKEP
ncbi:MAG: hypothetical protein R2744_12265, partial [Bacteroidales bacterium]